MGKYFTSTQNIFPYCTLTRAISIIYCSFDIFSQPVTIQFSLILLATRMRSVPYNINRTIWENTERSRDAEIFK